MAKNYGDGDYDKAQKVLYERRKETYKKKTGYENPGQNPEVKAKVRKTNLEWQGKLKSRTGLEFETEAQIGENKAWHADLGYKDILLEINPSISHFEDMSYMCLRNMCGDKTGTHENCPESKDKSYHYDRAMEAYKHGQLMLQIWDWVPQEWVLNKLSDALGIQPITYARKDLTISTVKDDEAVAFINRFGILAAGDDDFDESYGVYYKNELLYVQAYRKIDENEYQIVRTCTKRGVHIDDADELCFKMFTKRRKDAKTVYDYVDFGTFENDVDIQGFNDEGTTGPVKVWHKTRGVEEPIFDDKNLDDEKLKADGYHEIMLPGYLIKKWSRS